MTIVSRSLGTAGLSREGRRGSSWAIFRSSSWRSEPSKAGRSVRSFVEGRAQRVDVGPLVDDGVVGHRLLGAHVPQGAQHVAGRRQARFALEAGQAEVGDPQVAPAVDDQVRRLDVAVEHALLVGVLEGLGGLEAQPGRLLEEGRGTMAASRPATVGPIAGRASAGVGTPGCAGVTSRVDIDAVEARPGWESGRAAVRIPAAERVDPIGEGRAVDELHGVVVDAALAADRVDRDDVGVVQMRGRLGLDAEPGDLPRVDGGGEREDLQGHPTAQRVLLGLVDDAHAAAAELADDAEVAEPGTVGVPARRRIGVGSGVRDPASRSGPAPGGRPGPRPPPRPGGGS